jgi:addiction module RelE/StbE family toxin
LNVVITAEAESDLERIGDYIAQDSPHRALSFVQEIRQRCDRIAEAPKGFPLVPRYENFGVRRCVYGNYLIFYRIIDDTIEVLHVLHGATDYEPVLFPTD